MPSTIYLAGGCFWGMEKYFSSAKGVLKTTVGYANGNTINPSYEDVCKGIDTSSETVKIEYDKEVISLDKILELYLRVIDPYSLNKQGNDVGLQYRTGIYYIDQDDLPLINNYLNNNLEKDHKIEVMKLQSFYDAEEYHQAYLDKNPYGYCHIDLRKLKDNERK